MIAPTSDSKECSSLDKRKAGLFIVLVVIAMGCLVFMIWTLFFASPHTDPSIEKSHHTSQLRRDLVGLTALAACAIPTWRAASVEPMEALRYE